MIHQSAVKRYCLAGALSSDFWLQPSLTDEGLSGVFVSSYSMKFDHLISFESQSMKPVCQRSEATKTIVEPVSIYTISSSSQDGHIEAHSWDSFSFRLEPECIDFFLESTQVCYDVRSA